ncbi:MAG: LuxR C-terminal-related transcriptional regulator [Microterricola sp.]
MAELSQVAAPNALELDRLLLETKLAIPVPRMGFVSRSALIGTARKSECRIVAVTAPSGYGKSSLLAQWAAVEDRAVAYVSLDRFDDDAVTLLTLLATAFVQATGADASLVSSMHGHGAAALGRAAPRLAMALRTSPVDFVIMVDDLHVIASPGCHDVLGVVLGGVPAGSQIVTASRHEHADLARLRADGAVLEFNAESLTLDVNGAMQIFAQAQVPLSADLAADITERTEGWPVGLYLAALIARDSHDGVAAVSGDDRYISDYLYRESMSALSEEDQHFLRCTAVLEQFSAGLCDALLGESGSQARLREMEASNVFLIALDRRREWFRYHPLFREFLLGELRRVSPELIATLHLRAAEWYEANGSAASAVEHLLQTPARELSMRLVSELALPTYQAGQLETVQRWITKLGNSAIETHPPLGVLAGWIAVISGHANAAERLAATLEATSFDFVPFDGSASFESGRAMLRSVMCPTGPEQALADAQLALTLEPAWSMWRDQALSLAGEAELLLGHIDAADRHFAEASELASSAGNSDGQVLCDSERAIIAMDRGQWAEADALLASALRTIDEQHLEDYATAVLALAGAARLTLHRGDLKATQRELTRAMRARPVCTWAFPALATRVRLQLAQAHFAIGDHATARHLMREIDDILLHRPELGTLLDEIDALQSIISSPTTGAVGAAPLSPAELRLLPYLQTHLTVPEIGARLFVSRNTVSTEVGSIYRKLGVSSRAEAVERAMAIGLLGG